MKKMLLALAILAGFAATAEARELLDTRSMTCAEVRASVAAAGSAGLWMHTQFGTKRVFAPRADRCHWQYKTEGAFVRTLDFPSFRRCPAGWTCVYNNDHR